ncbi:MAG: hypothetical protein IJ550_02280 [Bacteroidaceae bacterium]|nr:hypothetical protein [Bacteroidaceae bacterium]
MKLEKIYGAEGRQDGLYKIGREKYEVIFGYGQDGENGYNYRRRYKHLPTAEELKTDIEDTVNASTDEKILTGFSWNGKNVYLSSENQFNFKAAYDLAVQSGGTTLPVKFKLGEDASGVPIYHTFEEMGEFTDFYTKAIAFVNATLNEGWEEKDTVDYVALLEGVQQ